MSITYECARCGARGPRDELCEPQPMYEYEKDEDDEDPIDQPWYRIPPSMPDHHNYFLDGRA
jgi:hypothetical protein